MNKYKKNTEFSQPDCKIGITGVNNPMLSDNISQIIRWYKGRVAFESHKINPDFRMAAAIL